MIPISKKGKRTVCSNHRGVSLIPVIPKLFASILLRRLTPSREQTIREQGGLRPGRGCVDQIFTLRQYMEHGHTYHRATIYVSPDLKAAFDSVDRLELFNLLLTQGVPEKYVNILISMYAHTSGKVRAYGQLSRTFNTTSGVGQGCPISLFLFKFFINDIIHRAMDKRIISGINVLEKGNSSDLEYADDIVCSFDSFEEAQATLNDLNVAAGRYGLRFAQSKCKVMLTDWTGSIIPLALSDEKLDFADSFTYLGSCINASGNIADEITPRISRSRAVYRNLRHFWRRMDIFNDLRPCV